MTPHALCVGCFGIKIRTNAAKLTNVRTARFRECRDLVRECEMFVENEAKVTSRVSGVKTPITTAIKHKTSSMQDCNVLHARSSMQEKLLHLQ